MCLRSALANLKHEVEGNCLLTYTVKRHTLQNLTIFTISVFEPLTILHNEGEGNMVEKVKFYIYFFFILIEHSCSKSI